MIAHRRWWRPGAALALVVLATSGCMGRHAIVAATGTNIGVEVSQNPANQAPYAKLGYQRAEWAVVPTNRSAEKDPGSAAGGAAAHGDVLMELRYGGIFDTGPSSGIYQRLAVGETAVQQPGASLMFARNADGNIDAATVSALQSVRSIPALPEGAATRMAQIANRRECKAGNAPLVDAAVAASGRWPTYDDFRDGNPMPTEAEAQAILDQLAGVSCDG